MRVPGAIVGLVVAMATAACGDDGLPPAPPLLTAGPVTIDTQMMTLTLGSTPALVQPRFLSIGTATTVEEAHYGAGSLVPMFARYADTLLPATAPGVTSYADPAFGRELRLLYAPTGPAFPIEGSPLELMLHDGARVTGWDIALTITGGTQYTVFTLDVDAREIISGPFGAPTAVSVDGTDLSIAADVTVLEACPAPGCWYFDATARRFQARVFAPTGIQRSISVR